MLCRSTTHLTLGSRHRLRRFVRLETPMKSAIHTPQPNSRFDTIRRSKLAGAYTPRTARVQEHQYRPGPLHQSHGFRPPIRRTAEFRSVCLGVTTSTTSTPYMQHAQSSYCKYTSPHKVLVPGSLTSGLEIFQTAERFPLEGIAP